MRIGYRRSRQPTASCWIFCRSNTARWCAQDSGCSASITAPVTCCQCGETRTRQKIERIVVYDPRSLARVWVNDSATGGYIAVPYRVPHPDMTLAESEAARTALQAAKAADRTEARLFDNVLQVRAIEEKGRTATSRMKAERSKLARRAANTSRAAPELAAVDPEMPPASVCFAAPVFITAFEDVEDL